MFQNTQMPAVNFGFPDVCLTPTPVGPIPIPYPNIAPTATAIPTIYNQFILCMPVHNLLTMEVLRRVAEHTRWNKRPDIIQELVQNPKTPRDVVAEVAKRLPPAQRRRLGLAESVNG